MVGAIHEWATVCARLRSFERCVIFQELLAEYDQLYEARETSRPPEWRGEEITFWRCEWTAWNHAVFGMQREIGLAENQSMQASAKIKGTERDSIWESAKVITPPLNDSNPNLK